MKILLTSDVYSPMINGVVTSVLNLKNQLEAEGHEVRVLTLAQPAEGNDWYQCGIRDENVWNLPSVAVGIVYPGARISWGATEPVIRELTAWKPDIVHSQTEFATFRLAKRIAGNTGAALIHTYHTVYEDYTHYFSPNRRWGRKMVKTFSRAVLNRTDGVIAPTGKVSDMLKGYGVTSPIYTVPSGISCKKYAGSRCGEDRTSQKVRTLVTVGRLAQEKNVQELLRYLSGTRGERYRFLIVGDGPYRKELERLSQKLGIQNRVEFAGMVKPESVADWYRKGDVFVSASNSETQGLTYIEALASGLPAVCRKDDCLSGVIQDGCNGWQYRSEDEFFEALAKLDSLSVYSRLSENARESAEVYDMGRFAKRVTEVYEDCLCRK